MFTMWLQSPDYCMIYPVHTGLVFSYYVLWVNFVRYRAPEVLLQSSFYTPAIGMWI